MNYLVVWTKGGGGHKTTMRQLFKKEPGEEVEFVDLIKPAPETSWWLVFFKKFLKTRVKKGIDVFDKNIALGNSRSLEEQVKHQPLLDLFANEDMREGLYERITKSNESTQEYKKYIIKQELDKLLDEYYLKYKSGKEKLDKNITEVFKQFDKKILKGAAYQGEISDEQWEIICEDEIINEKIRDIKINTGFLGSGRDFNILSKKTDNSEGGDFKIKKVVICQVNGLKGAAEAIKKFNSEEKNKYNPVSLEIVLTDYMSKHCAYMEGITQVNLYIQQLLEKEILNYVKTNQYQKKVFIKKLSQYKTKNKEVNKEIKKLIRLIEKKDNFLGSLFWDFRFRTKVSYLLSKDEYFKEIILNKTGGLGLFKRTTKDKTMHKWESLITFKVPKVTNQKLTLEPIYNYFNRFEFSKLSVILFLSRFLQGLVSIRRYFFNFINKKWSYSFSKYIVKIDMVDPNNYYVEDVFKETKNWKYVHRKENNKNLISSKKLKGQDFIENARRNKDAKILLSLGSQGNSEATVNFLNNFISSDQDTQENLIVLSGKAYEKTVENIDKEIKKYCRLHKKIESIKKFFNNLLFPLGLVKKHSKDHDNYSSKKIEGNIIIPPREENKFKFTKYTIGKKDVIVFNFIDQSFIRDLYLCTDIIIAKPGGLTTFEMTSLKIANYDKMGELFWFSEDSPAWEAENGKQAMRIMSEKKGMIINSKYYKNIQTGDIKSAKQITRNLKNSRDTYARGRDYSKIHKKVTTCSPVSKNILNSRTYSRSRRSRR